MRSLGTLLFSFFSLVLGSIPLSAHAKVIYRLDRPTAAPGETVRIEAIFFNSSQAGAVWTIPSEIVLQWRDAHTSPIRSLAKTLNNKKTVLNIPANNFAAAIWETTVPVQAHGVQAVSIEGESILMALEATHQEDHTVVTTTANVPVVNPRTGQPLPQSEVVRVGAHPESGPSPLETSLKEDELGHSAFDRFRSSVSEYQPVYFSLSARGHLTARFQLSAKYRLFHLAVNEKPHFFENLYFGYTQTSLWDLQKDSKPFIDTTFNPGFFWLSDNVWTSKNQNVRFGLATGIEHKSNGKGGLASRSLNDLFIQPSFNYRFDHGSTFSFGPKVMRYVDVEQGNADYADYFGHVDWNLRWAQDNGAVISSLYRQGKQRRRTIQLDLAWPLQRTWLNMNGYLHLQYFNGYGETLLGYNQRYDSQIRVGLALVP